MDSEGNGDLVLVGPGWLGAPLAETLARARGQGGRVWTVSRSGRPAPAGCHALCADITRGPDETAIAATLTAPIDAIVVCVAPSGTLGDSYAVYPAAARGAARLAAAFGVRAVVYLSSTGVYDRQDGSMVNEQTLIAPSNARVQALFDAELTVLATASGDRSATVLRAAGLYGPGRDPAARFAGGATPAATWCNFSWRDDVISAVTHVLALPPTGRGVIYNVTDDHPVQAGDITYALTGAHSEQAGPADAAGPVRAGRSNQRVSSAALLATGWRPLATTVFDGLAMLGHPLPGRPA
jgi:nucleoside-diphosphate-sugar epimerase